LYLAAAGVGRLGLLDSDVVELSNLQRQILHGERDIGKTKVQSAHNALRAISTTVEVDLIDERLTPENAADIVSRYDIIVEAVDNHATRKLIIQACKPGVPVVCAGIYGWQGKVMTTIVGQSACWGCVFGAVENAAPPPVIGVAPGVAGCMQAAEVIHIITSKPALVNRVVAMDLGTMGFQKLTVQKDPECPWCDEKHNKG
jgi:molybdopterin/thiamine biosynthesis adenylyltransferase